MDDLINLADRLDKLESAFQHNIRVGEVVQTNPEKGTVRVKFADADDFVTSEIPVLQRNTLKNKSYSLPDVGEQVVCNFMGHGQENGFVMGCIFSKPDACPVNSQDKQHMAFSDGTTIEYDRAAKTLNIDCVGEITIRAAGQVTIIGNPIHLNP